MGNTDSLLRLEKSSMSSSLDSLTSSEGGGGRGTLSVEIRVPKDLV